MNPTPDSTLDDPQKIIADLQRANAELQRRLEEALERETATAEVLGVINSSPSDLAPVFDAILEKALRLCGAEFGLMNTFDGKHFHHAADRGVPAAYASYRRGRGPIIFGLGTAPTRLVEGENLVHGADLMATEPYQRGNPNSRALVDLGGARSHLCVALRKGDILLGDIVIYRQEVRPFSDNQIALLQNFAAQAVIAMENARLITETREALEQQTATTEVLQVINSSPSALAPVFDSILEKAHALCGAAFGTLTVRDGARFRAVALHDVPEAFAEIVRLGYEPRPGTPIARLIAGEPLIHIPDLAELAGRLDDPVPRAGVELGGTRTLLMVPLRKDDSLLGVITAFRQEVLPFSERQIALLQNFAAQAVIAMENARLIAETREALEQQTATAEVLQVINSSPGDLAPVFEAMLEKALNLCGAALGTLYTYDGELMHAAAIRGAPPECAEFLRRGPHRPGAGALGRVVRGAPVVQIADLAADEVYHAVPLGRALVDLGKVRTNIVVPLRKDGVVLGAIAIYRQEVRPFTDKQIALLQNFAAQAVIAMENARLIAETREALEQQTATAEILGVINSSPGDLAPVFDAMLEKATRLCEAQTGHLLRYENGAFRRAASLGIPEEFDRLFPLDAPMPDAITRDSVVVRMLATRSVIHVHDLREDESYRAGAPAEVAAVDKAGIRSALFVPLLKEGEVVGAFLMHRLDVRPFSDQQIALVENFAAQAVIAMENARLLGELRQRTDEVGELNRGLEARVAEQVDELGRVGRLKRFLAPQLAELIVSQGDEKILESHRREIVVVFCDLRGYTAFSETAEPEEVLDFLREYHGALGPLVSQFEGTLDQFSGDGIMVFFNDPVPIPDPAERAVKMAVAMREAAGTLIAAWRRRGRMLGFGAGIAQGYATLGQIGFADRSGYTAIGTVCNLAARLCAEAKDGQILVAQRVAVAVEETVPVEEVGELTLKGLTQPVVAYNVPLTATQPAFRVIEGGPQSV